MGEPISNISKNDSNFIVMKKVTFKAKLACMFFGWMQRRKYYHLVKLYAKHGYSDPGGLAAQTVADGIKWFPVRRTKRLITF